MFIADLIFDLVRKGLRFSRKKSKAEQRSEDVWDRKHIMLVDGSCCVCGEPGVKETEMCIGPAPIPRR